VWTPVVSPGPSLAMQDIRWSRSKSETLTMKFEKSSKVDANGIRGVWGFPPGNFHN